MPVKFRLTIIRFWFFLSHLITSVLFYNNCQAFCKWKMLKYLWRNFKTIFVKLNALVKKTNNDDNSIGDIIDP